MPVLATFQWLGTGVSTLRRKPNELHYSGFQNEDLIVSLGDYVLIRNNDSTNPEDLSSCYVAQVKDLYDSDATEEPYQAKVLWFSRLFELPTSFTKTLIDVDYKHELVEENRKHWGETVDAESIFSKCSIVYWPTDISAGYKLPKSTEIPVFYCRYKFSGVRLLSVLPTVASRSSQKKKGSGCKGDLTPRSNTRSKSVNKRLTFQSFSPKESVVTPSKIHEEITNPSVLKPCVICIKKVDDEVCYSLKKNGSIKIDKILDNDIASEKSSPRTPRTRLTRSKLGTPQQRAAQIIGDIKKEEMEICSPYKFPIIHTIFRSEIKTSPKCEKDLFNIIKNKTTPKRSLMDDVDVKSSPPKRERTRRSLNFDEKIGKSDEVVTRYGRKVKSTLQMIDSDVESLLSTPKKSSSVKIQKPRKSKIYNSDISDSEESNYCPSGDSSDDDYGEPVTPKSTRQPSSKRRIAEPKVYGTPKTPSSFKKKSLPCTPTIPQRIQPVQTPSTLIEESRQRLHVSAVPNSLPCRDEEYADIYAFIESNLLNGTGGCMYISGVPGTGKTATVHEVVRNLEKERDVDNLPSFQFIEVNGMKMTDPYQCYVQIFKALTGERIAPQQAANMLEKRFSKPGPKQEAIILLVDELDKLWTRKQTVMYNIFDWPTKPSSKLTVVAIANTMDLPERMMMNRVSSRLGLTRKTFQPYTFKELQEIVMSRIQELNVFDPDAVQLVARKVAAVSGDARRALEICRRAAEVAEEGTVVLSPSKKKDVLVGMAHVDAALNQMLSSPEVAAIRGCSEFQKLYFKSLLSEFERTGAEETTLFKAYRELVRLCQFEGFRPPTTSDVSSISAHLASSHLILIDDFQSDLFMKIRLNVSIDDVNYALTGLTC